MSQTFTLKKQDNSASAINYINLIILIKFLPQ